MTARDDFTPPDAAAVPAIAEQLAGNGFRFHHIGVIVRDLAAAGATYRLLGFGPGHEEEVASQGVRVLLIPTGQNDQYVELFAPLAEGSLTQYLEKRGEGIHHIAFAVNDIRAALEQLGDNGVRLVDRVPRAGAHGLSVAFLHPSAAHGVLIELVEAERAVMPSVAPSR
jgi:methylmalonyl-CoA/ethylmalonyl-CoA epimerase